MSDKIHPEGVCFSLTVKNGNEALEFYKQAFGAVETVRMPAPDGGLAHGEFMIGPTKIFISDEAPDWQAFAMPDGTMSSCLFSINVTDCDAAHERALAAGAKSLSDPLDQFWGSRSSVVVDPYGYRWGIVQVVEELSMEEIQKRAAEMFAG